jgi:hypothetical protein
VLTLYGLHGSFRSVGVRTFDNTMVHERRHGTLKDGRPLNTTEPPIPNIVDLITCISKVYYRQSGDKYRIHILKENIPPEVERQAPTWLNAPIDPSLHKMSTS